MLRSAYENVKVLQRMHINSAMRKTKVSFKKINSVFLTNQCLFPSWQVNRQVKMFLNSSHSSVDDKNFLQDKFLPKGQNSARQKG